MEWKAPWLFRVKRLVINEEAGEWCRLPYPGHKKGCPMFNKKPTCPPKIGHVGRNFDLSGPLYLVHSEFDLNADIERRRKNWPDATERQLRCVLYWQETSRDQMRQRAKLAVYNLNLNQVSFCPEGMMVNVFATARLSGLQLDKTRHLKICRHVALIGMRA